jgi:hypothetical protein
MTLLVDALLTLNTNRATQLAWEPLCVGRSSDTRTRGVVSLEFTREYFARGFWHR